MDWTDPPARSILIIWYVLVLLFIVFGAEGADITSFHNTLVPSVALSIVEGGKAMAKAKSVGGTCTEAAHAQSPSKVFAHMDYMNFSQPRSKRNANEKVSTTKTLVSFRKPL